MLVSTSCEKDGSPGTSIKLDGTVLMSACWSAASDDIRQHCGEVHNLHYKDSNQNHSCKWIQREKLTVLMPFVQLKTSAVKFKGLELNFGFSYRTHVPKWRDTPIIIKPTLIHKIWYFAPSSRAALSITYQVRKTRPSLRSTQRTKCTAFVKHKLYLVHIMLMSKMNTLKVLKNVAC